MYKERNFSVITVKILVPADLSRLLLAHWTNGSLLSLRDF